MRRRVYTYPILTDKAGAYIFTSMRQSMSIGQLLGQINYLKMNKRRLAELEAKATPPDKEPHVFFMNYSEEGEPVTYSYSRRPGVTLTAEQVAEIKLTLPEGSKIINLDFVSPEEYKKRYPNYGGEN